MVEVCEFHKAMEDRSEQNAVGLEGKVSKSSLKWLATIFALPLIGAVLAAYAFIVTADYRYGSAHTANTNAANITILTERMFGIKAEIQSLQTNITADMTEIKRELRGLSREITRTNNDTRHTGK